MNESVVMFHIITIWILYPIIDYIQQKTHPFGCVCYFLTD